MSNEKWSIRTTAEVENGKTKMTKFNSNKKVANKLSSSEESV